MQPRNFFPRTNSLFNIKHITLDLKHTGLPDEQVYLLAARAKRLLVTYNSSDFKNRNGKKIYSDKLAKTSQINTNTEKIKSLLLKS